MNDEQYKAYRQEKTSPEFVRTELELLTKSLLSYFLELNFANTSENFRSWLLPCARDAQVRYLSLSPCHYNLIFSLQTVATTAFAIEIKYDPNFRLEIDLMTEKEARKSGEAYVLGSEDHTTTKAQEGKLNVARVRYAELRGMGDNPKPPHEKKYEVHFPPCLTPF